MPMDEMGISKSERGIYCGVATETPASGPSLEVILRTKPRRVCGCSNLITLPYPAPSKPAGQSFTGVMTDLVCGISLWDEEEGRLESAHMSARKSFRPPGAASTAVWGEYTEIPSWARRSKDCCWVFPKVRDFKPRKMIGSVLCQLTSSKVKLRNIDD